MRTPYALAAAAAFVVSPVAVPAANAAPPWDDVTASCRTYDTSCRPQGVRGGYHLAFNDEFNGTKLDTSKWNLGWSEGWNDPSTGLSGPTNSDETACYDNKNVSVSDGSLNLAVTDQSGACGGAANSVRTLKHRGASVNTAHKYDFARGVYEARVYVPADSSGSACANFPGVWSNDYSYPGDGDIDLFECLAPEQGGAGAGQWRVHTNADDWTEPHGTAGSPTGWHTFSYEWDTDQILFRYDGRVVGRAPYTLSARQYLVLDNSTGSWGGKDKLPANMKVDYVRVYQKR